MLYLVAVTLWIAQKNVDFSPQYSKTIKWFTKEKFEHAYIFSVPLLFYSEHKQKYQPAFLSELPMFFSDVNGNFVE